MCDWVKIQFGANLNILNEKFWECEGLMGMWGFSEMWDLRGMWGFRCVWGLRFMLGLRGIYVLGGWYLRVCVMWLSLGQADQLKYMFECIKMHAKTNLNAG